MLLYNAGAFQMGSEDFYEEERPVRRVEVDGFWIDPHPVTVANMGADVPVAGVLSDRLMTATPRAY